MTITEQQQQAIREYFAGRHIPSGLGDEHAACSLAGINLALYGLLTDAIPYCMSKRIGLWIICVQDEMTDDIRNSDRWRELLPLAAGTGREHEDVRLSMILEWMWETVLPYLQPLADKGGYGDAWRTMCQERTVKAARAVEGTPQNPWAAYAAAYAANAASYAAVNAEGAAADAEGAADAAAKAAKAAADAGAALAGTADAKAWEHFDPCGLLDRLIAVSEMEP